MADPEDDEPIEGDDEGVAGNAAAKKLSAAEVAKRNAAGFKAAERKKGLKPSREVTPEEQEFIENQQKEEEAKAIEKGLNQELKENAEALATPPNPKINTDPAPSNSEDAEDLNDYKSQYLLDQKKIKALEDKIKALEVGAAIDPSDMPGPKAEVIWCNVGGVEHVARVQDINYQKRTMNLYILHACYPVEGEATPAGKFDMPNVPWVGLRPEKDEDRVRTCYAK